MIIHTLLVLTKNSQLKLTIHFQWERDFHFKTHYCILETQLPLALVEKSVAVLRRWKFPSKNGCRWCRLKLDWLDCRNGRLRGNSTAISWWNFKFSLFFFFHGKFCDLTQRNMFFLRDKREFLKAFCVYDECDDGSVNGRGNSTKYSSGAK